MRHLLAALAAVLCLLPAAAAGDVINVSTPAALLDALYKQAKSGDRIVLAPGRYDGLHSKPGPLQFDPPVSITSANLERRAELGKFRVAGWKGLAFADLDFVLTPGSAPFEFLDCARITLHGNTFHGTLNDDPSDDPIGLGFARCDGLSITGNEFHQLLRGVVIGSSKNVKVAGNRFHDLASDGANFGAVNNVEVSGNTFRDFRVTLAGVHPDAIQFNTAGTTTPSTDIVIAGNLIEKGDGSYVQGIFLRDQVGTLPFERVTLRNNLMRCTGYNGIRIQGVRDLTLQGNELVTCAGENNTFLLVQRGDGVLSQDNRSVNIGFGTGVDASVNVVQTGDVLTKPVADLGAAVTATWLTAQAVTAPVDPRDARIAALEAQVATLTGRVDALTAQLAAASADAAALRARIDRLLAERAQALKLAKEARAAKAKNQYLDPLVALLSAPSP